MAKPLLIGIAASNSGAGKTTLACAVLEHYTRRSSRTERPKRWGAIKYTRTASEPSVTTNPEILKEPGKDTARLRAAGAADVAWVRSSRAGLSSALPEALKRLSSCEVILVEGNGAIEFLKPDIVLFIFGKNRKKWKPGIEMLSTRADIVLGEGGKPLLEGRDRQRFFRVLTGLFNERKGEGRDAQKGRGGKAPLRRCPQTR